MAREFDKFMRVRVSKAFVRRVSRYARSKNTTASAFTRSAVLIAMGEEPTPPPRRPAKRPTRQSEAVAP
jgi:hypothetical protein